MIVPLAAGGPSDTSARILAPKLSEVIGQSVVVDDGSNVTATTPDEFRALIRRETAKWTQIVKATGIQQQ